ncbi:MAG: phospholipase [Trebonia sp.]|nr:phospholipase [Trebonia sp.]
MTSRSRFRSTTKVAATASAAVLALLLGTVPAASALAAPAVAAAVPHAATTPIKHFVFLMQGGRTFDNYFGTYPGADGLGAGTCQPLSVSGPAGPCVKPFLLDNSDRAPLGASATIIASQWDGGKMNGFVAAYQQQGRDGAMAMGYYNATQLPFYWEAAQNYVLFDHFFSSAQYGIRNSRSYWVSASPAPGGTGRIPAGGYGNLQTIFDRLQAAHVSWKFYVQGYNPAQTYASVSPDSSETQTARVPLVDFQRFTHDPSLASHIVGLDQYYRDLRAGTLPAVAYVASSSGDDERSAQSVSAGQSMVDTMTTQLMESRYWDNSAFMWSYDGSGGWYDSVRPPTVAGQPLGYRVPALLISAYARKGLVSHTVLDYTSALRFIEQNWTLAPLTARDAHANSLLGAFDFGQGPRSPVLLRAGPASQLDAFPTARSLTGHQARAVYVLYGGAATVTILLPVIAALATARSSRRRIRAASGTESAEERAG